MNNQQLYNHISELIKEEDVGNYVTSYPRGNKQIYVAYYNGGEIEAWNLHQLKDLVEHKINEVA